MKKLIFTAIGLSIIFFSAFCGKPSEDSKEPFAGKSSVKETTDTINIEAEVNYFQGEHSNSYERTYGWALSQFMHSVIEENK